MVLVEKLCDLSEAINAASEQEILLLRAERASLFAQLKQRDPALYAQTVGVLQANYNIPESELPIACRGRERHDHTRRGASAPSAAARRRLLNM